MAVPGRLQYFGAVVLWVGMLATGCSSGSGSSLFVVSARRIYLKITDTQVVWTTAIAIQDGRVVDTGSLTSLRERYPDASTLSFPYAYILPGLWDCHIHVVGHLWRRGVDLTGVRSPVEFIERLRGAQPTHGEWLIGRGWDHTRWQPPHLPTRHLLDSLFPAIPVLLYRVDGHMALVNSEALRRAHLHEDTAVEGGEVLTDATGTPTGILIDKAIELVEKLIPEPNSRVIEEQFIRLQDSLLSAGITAVCEMGLNRNQIDWLLQMDRKGKVKIEFVVYALPTEENWQLLSEGALHSRRVHVVGFKLFMDGALGSRGALLMEPYNDSPGWYGLLVMLPEELRLWLERAVRARLRVAVHAIGDSACRLVLRTVEQMDRHPLLQLEHLQVVHPEDVKLIGKLGVVPSVQPRHAVSDSRWAGERLGAERLSRAYSYRSLYENAGVLLLGSDWPVESFDPRVTLFSAVERREPHATEEFRPEEALPLRIALAGMTAFPAKQYPEVGIGKLTVGAPATFVVWDRDLLEARGEELLTARVLRVWVVGELLFSNFESKQEER